MGNTCMHVCLCTHWAVMCRMAGMQSTCNCATSLSKLGQCSNIGPLLPRLYSLLCWRLFGSRSCCWTLSLMLPLQPSLSMWWLMWPHGLRLLCEWARQLCWHLLT